MSLRSDKGKPVLNGIEDLIKRNKSIEMSIDDFDQREENRCLALKNLKTGVKQ